MLRGGSWNNETINLRGANRNRNNPNNRNNNRGFRCVRAKHVIFMGQNLLIDRSAKRAGVKLRLVPALNYQPN
jgi:hypothetical protein